MSSSLALLWSCKQHVLYATNNHTICQLSLTSAHITQQMQWKKLTFEIHSSIIWKSLTSSTLKLTLLTQSVTRKKTKLIIFHNTCNRLTMRPFISHQGDISNMTGYRPIQQTEMHRLIYGSPFSFIKAVYIFYAHHKFTVFPKHLPKATNKYVIELPVMQCSYQIQLVHKQHGANVLDELTQAVPELNLGQHIYHTVQPSWHCLLTVLEELLGQRQLALVNTLQTTAQFIKNQQTYLQFYMHQWKRLLACYL